MDFLLSVISNVEDAEFKRRVTGSLLQTVYNAALKDQLTGTNSKTTMRASYRMVTAARRFSSFTDKTCQTISDSSRVSQTNKAVLDG